MNTPLVMLDALGSVRTRCGTFEAICWTHRGQGWDVHSTISSEGAAVRTKREAYALVRKMHKAYWDAQYALTANDSRCWT